MGYDSYLDFELDLLDGVTEKSFRKTFKETYKEAEGSGNLKFWLDNFVFTGRTLTLDDGSMRFRDNDKISEVLAPMVKGTIWVDGESSDDKWKIDFDGKGKWKYVYSTLLYDYEPYKTFMKHFEKEMPKQLKTELEKWHMALEV